MATATQRPPILSLFLNHLRRTITSQEIMTAFQEMQLGDVCYVDIIKHRTGLWKAGVYFKTWYATPEAQALQEQLLKADAATEGIIYSQKKHPEEWHLSINKYSHPKNMTPVHDSMLNIQAKMADMQHQIIQLKYNITAAQILYSDMYEFVESYAEGKKALREKEQNEELSNAEITAHTTVEQVLQVPEKKWKPVTPPLVLAKRRRSVTPPIKSQQAQQQQAQQQQQVQQQQRPSTPTAMPTAMPTAGRLRSARTPTPPLLSSSSALLPKFMHDTVMQEGKSTSSSSQPPPYAQNFPQLARPSLRRNHSVPCSVPMEIRYPPCHGCDLFNKGVGGFNQEAHACLGY